MSNYKKSGIVLEFLRLEENAGKKLTAREIACSLSLQCNSVRTMLKKLVSDGLVLQEGYRRFIGPGKGYSAKVLFRFYVKEDKGAVN